ncbi:MAG: SDR family NAD(P)-dependent oxidoreductase [Anaerolineae bacterium]
MERAMFRLDGKTALVTGAAGGIGAGIAETLARQGASVAIADLPGASLEATAAKCGAHGGRVFTLALDIRSAAQRDAGVAAVQAEFGHLDILVNNAGINRPMGPLEVTEDNWDDHFATNVKGGFFLAQRAAPAMIEQGWGRIIFMASQAGIVALPGMPAYCTSKAAVVQAVRTLGIEWAKYGVTVNAVAPTTVETDLNRARLQNPEFRSYCLGKIPAGRFAQIPDVTACIAFLASEEAAMVNCFTLRVDGGWTAW